MSSQRTTLEIARDKSLQFPGFLVTLQAIDEIDLDLRAVKAGCGKPISDLPAKRRSVDRPACDYADLGAIPSLDNLILGNVWVLTERCPKNQWMDMNTAGINEDVVRAPFHAADEGEMRTARAGSVAWNRDIRQLVTDQRQGPVEERCDQHTSDGAGVPRRLVLVVDELGDDEIVGHMHALMGVAFDANVTDFHTAPHIVDFHAPDLANGVARLGQERL